MCGIIGVFDRENAFELVQGALKKIKERGKDGIGLYDSKEIQYARDISQLTRVKSNYVIGHVLHSIVHTVHQPIKFKDSYLVANCEIYNWKELCKKYSISAENDSVLLLKLLNKIGVKKALAELRGVYSFCYWNGDDVYLARDSIGIKPLWYSTENGLVFCSERKGIVTAASNIIELNPRQIRHYSISTTKVRFLKRSFFTLKSNFDGEDKAVKKVRELLQKSVELRIPDRKFGLLLSGGIDSVLIAKILKDLGQTFTCYIAATSEEKEEVQIAKKIAKELDLDLKSIIVYEENIEHYLKKVVPLIEDSNVVKVGVATTIAIACEQARRDGCKVIFSGSGADELFGGYFRYRNQASLKNLNKDCYSDILKFYEKNSYRDDVVTMHNNLELRVPFLDKKLVGYGLNVDPKLKIKAIDKIESLKKINNNNHGDLVEKYILRRVAEFLGLPGYIVHRKKKAAQYGSGIDKAIGKAAKKNGFSSKSAYLDTFLPKKIMRLGALISGGKDSWYAAYIMKQQNYDISCLITLKSKNRSSYMFHTPNIDLVSLQSKASGIPLIEQKTSGVKEKELVDLKKAIARAKKEYGIEGVVSGALYSNYQRERIEKICDELGLKIFSPLWHIDQLQLLVSLIKNKFEVIISAIAADGLTEKKLGRQIDTGMIKDLKNLNEKIGMNIAFEGGEAETFVLNCPLFKQKIKIHEAEKVMESECVGLYLIKEIGLL